jgi:hypothetical protein
MVPRYVEIGTNNQLFVHRTGTNAYYGKYFADYTPGSKPGHLSNYRVINIKKMREYLHNAETTEELKCTSDTLYLPANQFTSTLLERLDVLIDFLDSPKRRSNTKQLPDKETVLNLIDKLDGKGRWLVTNAEISNPYIGMPETGDINSTMYSTTEVGDKYDTSRFEDHSGQKYISTAEYCWNMKILIDYLENSDK